ncbi:Peptidase A8, signal peptidase II [Acididesulfobacillus acetoxydans]|uniref:Lipoprotein signal peptidase n=1 Tax=Acididesulfobacillus acetoxydans TaxID=1561005 RepID=A0A8S0VYB3_9FIRM|nr:signal peptidase II [Acididesulfobacillus acetoxydans]CAA7602853.1 Peptidase A8, signal peptidase II [Acididesulfobacillus acetoxydans]CEJ05734.1 Signal peptidases II signature [Acididesulfobacillus acetoxydans]
MLVWATMIAVWIIDRALKIVIETRFVPGQSLVLIPKVLHLTYVLNPGAAFGLMAGRTWIFIATALVVVLIIVFAQRKIPKGEVMIRLAMGMIAGGALGNLYDRIHSGLVIDYLDFRIWPFVFNFADSMIVIGVGLLLLAVYRKERRGGE